MTADIAIGVRGLGKRYQLGARAAHNSIRDVLQERVRSLRKRGASGPSGTKAACEEHFWALQDVTFDVPRGENIGIIGLNGAGKSTLLKILSRITTPTAGTARISGRLGALLEVGTGFHAELTGRENVYLYGSILGMSRQEIASKFDAIVDFSEIREFIDTPVKRYSSGMYVRLAFAVAAHLDPDILLLDEVLAVGDFTFQRKCMDFAARLVRGGSTILFVSHNMHSIKTMCRRVIYLKGGRVIFDGPTDEGLGLYESDSRLAPAPWFRPSGEQPVKITNVELLTEDGQPRTMFDFGERLRIRISYRTSEPIDAPHFLCSITRSDNVLCSNYSSWTDGAPFDRIDGEGVIDVLTPALSLVSDRYTVTIVVRQHGFERMLGAQVGGAFHLRHEVFGLAFGVFHERADWAHRRGR
jgi:homopolymeric O-antigen transport system ATP-binding protein